MYFLNINPQIVLDTLQPADAQLLHCHQAQPIDIGFAFCA